MAFGDDDDAADALRLELLEVIPHNGRARPPHPFYAHSSEEFQIIETAGLHNTAGFNDDTRAFPSIPARHDLWRRVAANWIAGLVVRGIVDMDDAEEMILDTAYRLAKRAYKFDLA